jgi:pyruvyltransferase
VTVYLKQFSDTPNAGDAIGSRIVEAVTGRATRIVGEAPLSVPNLIGIGSIAHWADEYSWLWGCGLVNEHIEVRAPAEVLAVRGRLTRDGLTRRGIRCGDLLGDVGLLLPDLIAPSQPRHPVGLVPHYVDSDSAFVKDCLRAGVPVVNVSASLEQYVEQLTSCRRILSSSLHGIVFAHAYGIDAAWVKISDRVHGDGFKFYDYYSSLGVESSDVRALSPLDSTIEKMSESCWRPDALPDRISLGQSLVQRISEIDV